MDESESGQSLWAAEQRSSEQFEKWLHNDCTGNQAPGAECSSAEEAGLRARSARDTETEACWEEVLGVLFLQRSERTGCAGSCAKLECDEQEGNGAQNAGGTGPFPCCPWERRSLPHSTNTFEHLEHMRPALSRSKS